MTVDYFIGIDPGNTGALAISGPYDTWSIVDYEDPLFFTVLSNIRSNSRCCLEAVHSMPKQGVASTFKFGKAAGMAEGMLKALQIPYTLVTPQKWQAAMMDSAGKGSGKSPTLDLARRLHPSLLPVLMRAKDHNRADAILLADYCRRISITNS